MQEDELLLLGPALGRVGSPLPPLPSGYQPYSQSKPVVVVILNDDEPVSTNTSTSSFNEERMNTQRPLENSAADNKCTKSKDEVSPTNSQGISMMTPVTERWNIAINNRTHFYPYHSSEKRNHAKRKEARFEIHNFQNDFVRDYYSNEKYTKRFYTKGNREENILPSIQRNASSKFNYVQEVEIFDDTRVDIVPSNVESNIIMKTKRDFESNGSENSINNDRSTESNECIICARRDDSGLFLASFSDRLNSLTSDSEARNHISLSARGQYSNDTFSAELQGYGNIHCSPNDEYEETNINDVEQNISQKLVNEHSEEYIFNEKLLEIGNNSKDTFSAKLQCYGNMHCSPNDEYEETNMNQDKHEISQNIVNEHSEEYIFNERLLEINNNSKDTLSAKLQCYENMPCSPNDEFEETNANQDKKKISQNIVKELSEEYILNERTLEMDNNSKESFSAKLQCYRNTHCSINDEFEETNINQDTNEISQNILNEHSEEYIFNERVLEIDNESGYSSPNIPEKDDFSGDNETEKKTCGILQQASNKPHSFHHPVNSHSTSPLDYHGRIDGDPAKCFVDESLELSMSLNRMAIDLPNTVFTFDSSFNNLCRKDKRQIPLSQSPVQTAVQEGQYTFQNAGDFYKNGQDSRIEIISNDSYSSLTNEPHIPSNIDTAMRGFDDINFLLTDIMEGSGVLRTAIKCNGSIHHSLPSQPTNCINSETNTSNSISIDNLQFGSDNSEDQEVPCRRDAVTPVTEDFDKLPHECHTALERDVVDCDSRDNVVLSQSTNADSSVTNICNSSSSTDLHNQNQNVKLSTPSIREISSPLPAHGDQRSNDHQTCNMLSNEQDNDIHSIENNNINGSSNCLFSECLRDSASTDVRLEDSNRQSDENKCSDNAGCDENGCLESQKIQSKNSAIEVGSEEQLDTFSDEGVDAKEVPPNSTKNYNHASTLESLHRKRSESPTKRFTKKSSVSLKRNHSKTQTQPKDKLPSKKVKSSRLKRRPSQSNGAEITGNDDNCDNPTSASTSRKRSSTVPPTGSSEESSLKKISSGGKASERRSRRGVGTRLRARQLQSEGAVWQQPTDTDYKGRMRDWPDRGMHERPVWPLPPEELWPPRPQSPATVEAEAAAYASALARQQALEVRLHRTLAACMQVYKDILRREIKRNVSTGAENEVACYCSKSVIDIHRDNELYRYFEAEILYLLCSKEKRKFDICATPNCKEHVNSSTLIFVEGNRDHAAEKSGNQPTLHLKDIERALTQVSNGLSDTDDELLTSLRNLLEKHTGGNESVCINHHCCGKNSTNGNSLLETRKNIIIDKVLKSIDQFWPVNYNVCSNKNGTEFFMRSCKEMHTDTLLVYRVKEAFVSILDNLSREYCLQKDMTRNQLSKYINELDFSSILELMEKRSFEDLWMY